MMFGVPMHIQTAPELEDAGILIIQNWDSYFFPCRFDFPGTHTIHGMVFFYYKFGSILNSRVSFTDNSIWTNGIIFTFIW